MSISHSLALAGFDGLPTQLALLDEAGEIVYTNREWREFGADNDYRGDVGMVGVNYLDVCGASETEDATMVHGGIRAVIDGETEHFTFEYPCHSPDERRWFTMRATQFRHEGERYVLVVHFNITDRKLAEMEAEERADRLQNLAQLLSHDLKNPVAVASGYVDLLGADLGDDSRLLKVKRAIDRMEQILNDALVLARYDDIDDADKRLVSLWKAAERAWEVVDTKSATLQRADSPQLSFYADSSLLQHVFENLFKNAVEHGGDSVNVTVGVLDDGHGIYVEDDGPGIAPEDRDEIFDRGYTTTTDGTGLGLAIVAQIVDSHDWDISYTGRFEITGVQPVE